MEQERRVATTGGTFLDTAIQNIEDMKVAAQMILDSKLAPDHFYEKNDKNKPDYTKGNVASVILVCTHGHDLGLKPLVALQHVIPVNGLLSIKGDAAKTLIFNSGKLEAGSWKELVTGTIAGEDYEISITAKRIDTQEIMTRSFGIAQAKRAGLWITDKLIKGQDGWKYLKSAWYKYPERMMTYRALGFLARDLFPDVLSGSYTTEEAMDIPQDTTLVVQTPGGPDVIIPDKEFNQTRSEDLTAKANNQIDKRAVKAEPPPPPTDAVTAHAANIRQQPMTPDESYQATDRDPEARDSIATMLNGTPGFIGVYTEEELKVMDSQDLNSLIECDGMMTMARNKVPGKNTNKKLRSILLAHFAGDVVSLVAKHDAEYQDPLNQEKKRPDPESLPTPTEPESDEIPMEAVDGQEEDPDPIADIPQSPGPDTVNDSNKFNIEVPELHDGKRGFEQVKILYEDMLSQAGLDNKAFEALVTTKFPQFQQYRVKEDFCYKAPSSDINTLLNSI